MYIYNNKIAITDIVENTMAIKNKLAQNGEVLIFENNRPQFILMDISRYEELIKNKDNETESNPVENEECNEEVDVKTLLNKIGRNIFIEYYHDFKNGQNIEEKLPSYLSLSSKQSRITSARKIFINNLHIEALELIANSNRLEEETLDRAKVILKSEIGKKR